MPPAPANVSLRDEWDRGDYELQMAWSRPGLPVRRPMVSAQLELHIDGYLEEDGCHKSCQFISMPIRMRAASRLATMRGAREAVLSDVLMEDHGPLPVEALAFLADGLSRYICEVAAATARSEAGSVLTEVRAEAHVRLLVDDDPHEEDTEWEDMAVDNDDDYSELPPLSTGEGTRLGEDQEQEDTAEEVDEYDDNDDWVNGDYRGGPPLPAGRAEEEEAEEEEARCTICLDKMAGRDRRWLRCSHSFHGDCVERWLQHKPQCPLCRHKVARPA